MTSGAPIEAAWDGEVFRPVSPYWVRRADKDFSKGEVLRLVNQQARSTNSHNHYFAAVASAWENLPPLVAERFNSPDALRKYALIKGGYCTSDSITCPSHADALRVAAFVRPTDEFALVTVTKNVVTRYIAKSQSYREMDKKTFAESKDRVLEIIAELIGVTSAELKAAQPTQRDYLAAG
jgi:hypothetical protein